MSNLATKRQVLETALETGVVRSVDGEGKARTFLVQDLAGLGRARARRARSCLVPPAVGERVLVAQSGEDAWVLAVLEPAGEQATELRAEGDLTVRATGKLKVVAAEGIEAVTADQAKLVAQEVRLDAAVLSASVERIGVFGRALEAHIDRVRLAATTCDTYADRVLCKVKRALRFVSELDQTRAGAVDVVAKGNVRVHAGETMFTAERLVKLDGEQVQIG